MATKKVTITIGEEQLAAIQELVAQAAASSVSGFVQHAIEVALDDVRGWGATLAAALEGSGGPLTDLERAWADQLLGHGAPVTRSGPLALPAVAD